MNIFKEKNPSEKFENISDNMLMEDSNNAGKGKKIVKFIGITLLVIFVIGGGIFFAIGAGLFSMGQAIIDSANSTHIENKIEQKNGMIEITLPLEKQYALHYDNLKLCTPPSKASEMFFKRVDAGDFGASTRCSHGICSVSIGLENNREYPKSILAYVTEGGLCQQKRISTDSKPVVENHEALVEMTSELLGMLGIEGDRYKVTVKGTQISNSWQLLGTKKVAFYYENLLSSDDLMIDGFKKAKLIYLYKNTNQVVQSPRTTNSVKKVLTAPIIKPKIVKKLTLEEEKKALEEELKSLQEAEIQALEEEKEALEKELEALKG